MSSPGRRAASSRRRRLRCVRTPFDGVGRRAAIRIAYAAAAAAFVAYAVWGTLFPFDFHAVPLETAARLFWQPARPAPDRCPLTDLVSNVLLFLPIGLFMSAALEASPEKGCMSLLRDRAPHADRGDRLERHHRVRAGVRVVAHAIDSSTWRPRSLARRPASRSGTTSATEIDALLRGGPAHGRTFDARRTDPAGLLRGVCDRLVAARRLHAASGRDRRQATAQAAAAAVRPVAGRRHAVQSWRRSRPPRSRSGCAAGALRRRLAPPLRRERRAHRGDWRSWRWSWCRFRSSRARPTRTELLAALGGSTAGSAAASLRRPGDGRRRRLARRAIAAAIIAAAWASPSSSSGGRFSITTDAHACLPGGDAVVAQRRSGGRRASPDVLPGADPGGGRWTCSSARASIRASSGCRRCSWPGAPASCSSICEGGRVLLMGGRPTLTVRAPQSCRRWRAALPSRSATMSDRLHPREAR